MDTRPDSFRTTPGTPFAGGEGPLPSRDVAAIHAAVQAYARVAATTPDFAPHAQLAYQQLGTLGEGGMGVVYRMRDQRLGREVAVKLIRGTPSPQRLGRFRREALLTAGLEHPAIPPVYEAGTTPDGTPYLVMRLIEGRPLAALIRDHHERQQRTEPALRRAERRRLLEALLKVAEAVAYAHDAGVIHRDLKPDNVLVGAYGEVVLMDWGLAKRLDERGVEDPAGLTHAGAMLGTPGYVSPEQATGRSDARSDVFSLGAILTEILTAQLPVSGQGGALLGNLAAGQIARPRDLARDVPPELDAIAAAALAFDANQRTQTAANFAAQLRAWLDGEDVPGQRYGPLERLRRGIRRHPTAAIASLAGVLLLGVVSLAGAVVAESRRQQLASEAREREAAQQRELAAAREREAEQQRELAAAGAREAEATRARFEHAMDLLARAEPELLRGKTREGLALVDEALAGDPSRALIWHAARVCQAGKAYERAKELLEHLIAVYPPGLDALYQLHRIEAEERNIVVGSQTPAMDRLREAAKLHGENAFTLLDEALQAYEAGRLEEGLAKTTRALELSPSLGHAASLRGAIRHGLGDLPGAIADTQLAVRLEPLHYVAWSNLGFMLGEANRADEGLVALNRSLAIQPTPAAHNNLATVLFSLSRFSEAIRHYDQALAALPNTPGWLVNRGNAKYKLGRFAEAIADFDAAVALEPRMLKAYYGRAICLESLGHLDEAARILDELLRRAPNHPDVESWRESVERIQRARAQPPAGAR